MGEVYFNERVPEVYRRGQGNVADAVYALNGAFGDVSPDKFGSLVGKLEKSFSGSDGENRATFVKTILRSRNSERFHTHLSNSGLIENQIPSLMADEGMIGFVSTMIEHREKYKMELGAIFSQVSLGQFPGGIRNELQIKTAKVDALVRPFHDKWELCDLAEYKLVLALESGGVMAVGEQENPNMLMKFRGRLTGLCLQDTETTSGNVFIKGNWYSPTDFGTRKDLEMSFDRGKGRVPVLDGEWALMRPLRTVGDATPEEIVDMTEKIAQGLPNVASDDKIYIEDKLYTRKEYRSIFKEDYVDCVDF